MLNLAFNAVISWSSLWTSRLLLLVTPNRAYAQFDSVPNKNLSFCEHLQLWAKTKKVSYVWG